MGYNLPKRDERDIIKIAKMNGVEKLILFGSRAKGTCSERSDIDLAGRLIGLAAFLLPSMQVDCQWQFSLLMYRIRCIQKSFFPVKMEKKRKTSSMGEQ